MIRDYAFIVKCKSTQVFRNDDAVEKAVKAMDGGDFQEHKLKVEIAGQPKKPKGPQPNDECRYCGKKGHWYAFS